MIWMMTKGKKMTLMEIDEIEERFREVFATKEDLIEFKSDLLDKLDSILKEIIASREEQTVIFYRVANHGNRLEVVENKLNITPTV